MRKGIIYCAYNKINNKRYIGQTIQELKERQRKHYQTDGCPYFHKALLKYDKDSWEWTILEELNQDQLNEREEYWISYYETTNPEKGYNISKGGDNHYQTQEQIRYARDKFIENYSIDNIIYHTSKNIRCIETGEVFKTAKDAGKQKNITYSHITEVANGKLKTAGGYHWEWCVDLSFFPYAIYCKELDIIYKNCNEAHTLGHFSYSKIKKAFDNSAESFIYAGYTFYKLNYPE